MQAKPGLAALAPAASRDRGVLRVATMNNYKPYSYTDDGAHVGVLPEMATAVAQVMGLKAEITAIEFSSILTGIQAQCYDIGMGEYFVREDRLKVADFVTEWSNYNAFVVSAAGGAAAPEVQTFSVMNDAVLALTSGRVDAVLTGREVGLSLEQDGVPVVAVGKVGGGPTATAVGRSPEADGLPEAIAAAYRALIADGAYETIHTRWNTDYGMIDDPTVYRAGDTPPTYAD